MPKYTKLIPPDEYEKLTLEEKEAYIIDMADLLRPRAPPSTPDDPTPPDDKPKKP